LQKEHVFLLSACLLLDSMERRQLVNRYFQKQQQLALSKKQYVLHLSTLWEWMLAADDAGSDATADFIAGNGKAIVTGKQEGIVAGIEEVVFLLRNKTNLLVTESVKDGAKVGKKEIWLTMEGSNQYLLSYERTVLNILGRMSGIATLTSNLLSDVQKEENPPFLAATRKTPLMFLDKKAVAIGGGLTHRLSLSDFPIIKDNHLEILKKGKLSIEKAIETAVKKTMQSFFEIEVKNVNEVHMVLKVLQSSGIKKDSFVCSILLDNFTPLIAREVILEIKNHPLYKHVLLEASGEITQENLSMWAKTGVDILSMGILTHSSPTFNLSLKIV